MKKNNMTVEKRLQLIYQIAREHCIMGWDDVDGYESISTLCDVNLSEDDFNLEIDKIKKMYPFLATLI